MRTVLLRGIFGFLPVLGFGAAWGAETPAGAVWSGVVRDASDHPAAGAAVSLQSDRNSYAVVTTAGGAFRFGAAATGPYRLAIRFNDHLFRLAETVTVPADGVFTLGLAG